MNASFYCRDNPRVVPTAQAKIRKRNRLRDYNYSIPGWYFVTICVAHKICYFGEIKNEKMLLNKYGQIIENQWLWLAKQYSYLELDQYSIMPNHLHGIVIIKDKTTNASYAALNDYSRRGNLLSKAISAFKTTSSKLIHNIGMIHFEWQRSFYDHIIRREADLYKIQTYINNNPLKWALDKYYVR